MCNSTLGQMGNRKASPHCGSRVFILGPKISMTIDERRSHTERLCKPDKSIVDSRISVRVVLPQYLSHNACRLPARGRMW